MLTVKATGPVKPLRDVAVIVMGALVAPLATVTFGKQGPSAKSGLVVETTSTMVFGPSAFGNKVAPR